MRFTAAGIALVGLEFIALRLSPQFAYSIALSGQPVIGWVSIQVLAGVCYVYGFFQLRHLRTGMTLLAFIALTGLLMRGLMCFSTPVLETDFYRYLWDGAMLANGQNPYAWSPETIKTGAPAVPAAVVELAVASQPVLDRINHPQVTTIYPLASVSAFALAYLMDPWSIEALRGVYLALDLTSLCVLGLLLKRRPESLPWVFVFWCNPVLVRFVYNGLHMDIIVVCLVSLVLFGMARRSRPLCAVALGAAIGAKVWPVLIGVHLWIRERMRAGVLAGLVLGAALLWPMLPAPPHADDGLLAYARTWEMNDPLFRFIALAAGAVIESESGAALAARLVSAAAFVLVLVYLYRSRRESGEPLDALLIMLGAFLLLLPAPYPWYFLWLLPLLTLRPVLALIGLAATLPLYDLRFYFEPRDMKAWFDYAVVLIEFSPLLLLSSGSISARRAKRPCTEI